MVSAITFGDSAAVHSLFSGSIYAVSYKAKFHINDIENELMK